MTNGKIINGMVPSSAAIDTFTAPDSMASRPSPGTMADRPQKPVVEPAITLESNLNED